MNGIDLFETEIKPDFIYKSTESMLNRAGSASAFSIIRFGAGHNVVDLNSYQEWSDQYIPMYKRAQQMLKKMVSLILSKDPEAVIIATGDHGAMQYIDVWAHQDVNEGIVEKQLTHELIARSFFDVFLAIRWPEHLKKIPKIYSHINLFKHLFAVLAENKSFLQELKADISITRNYLVIDRGNILSAFTPLGDRLLDYDIEEAERMLEIRSDDNSSQLQLAQLLIDKNPRKSERILSGLLEKHDNREAMVMLGGLLFRQNRIEEAKEIYFKLTNSSERVDDYLVYADILRILGRVEDAEKVLLNAKKLFAANAYPVKRKLLSLYFYQEEWEKGLAFYLENYDPKTNLDSVATLIYLKILLKLEKHAEIDEAFKVIPCNTMHLSTNLHIYNIGYTFINMSRRDWDAPCKSDIVTPYNQMPKGGWSSFTKYYCMEKQGAVDKVVLRIVEHLTKNVKNSAQLGEYLGKLLIRNNITINELDEYKKYAEKIVQERFRIYAELNIFDTNWYRDKYLRDLKDNRIAKLHPILHYLYYGLYEGACPNPYFDTYHCIESSLSICRDGFDPLWYYLLAGSGDIFDPSPHFSVKRYLHENDLKMGEVNPLIHVMQSASHIRKTGT